MKQNPQELVTLLVTNTGNYDVNRLHRNFPRGETVTVRVPRGRAFEITAHVDLKCEETE